MSNPYSKENLEVAGRAWALDTFWNAQSKNSLQTWPSTDSRVLHLSTNKRSGEDTWFSQLLDACRVGNMDHIDYCFLHGFPTEKCGSWMVQHKLQLVVMSNAWSSASTCNMLSLIKLRHGKEDHICCKNRNAMSAKANANAVREFCSAMP